MNQVSTDLELTADLVVDVASLGYAIGEARTDRNARPLALVRPDLSALVEAMAQRQFTVRSVHVALPLVPVRVGPDSDEQRARRWVQEWEDWVSEQAGCLSEISSIPLVPVAGGTDGTAEVGVDEVVTWTALELAANIADTGDPSTEVVVVVSSDSDLWHLSTYAAPTRLFVAGRFTRGRRDTLLESRIPFLRLSDDTLLGMDSSSPSQLPDVKVGRAKDLLPASAVSRTFQPDDRIVIEYAGGSQIFVGSSPLDAVVPDSHRENNALRAARTVAVVDGYGMFVTIRRAIGAAGLPDAEQVRSLLGMLGWDGPIATLFVLPDLSEHHAKRANLSDGVRRAWHLRDRDLDNLAQDLEEDDDELTQSRRSELRPANESTALKRMATGLVAELWRAHRFAPDADLVVLTEDPDVCMVLREPPEWVTNWPRITRVGVHPNRVEMLNASPLTGLGHPGQVVVLTEYLAAILVGVVDQVFGRSLRDALALATSGPVVIEAEGVDPESGGTAISIVELDGMRRIPASLSDADTTLGELRTILHNVEGGSVAPTLIAAVGDLNERAAVGLHFDPRRRCSVPRMVLSDDHGDAGRIREAKVVYREGYQLWVDIDYDGIADIAVPTGHDTTRYQPDDLVSVIQLPAGGPWALHNPGPPIGTAPDPIPDVITIESVGEGGGWAQDIDTGVRGWVEPLPGESDLRAARHVLAVRLDDSPTGTAEWLAISSALDHLERMLDLPR